MSSPYFNASGDCRVTAGEALAVLFSVRSTKTGPDIDLTGRTFALTVYEAATEREVESATATASGASVSLVLPGSLTRLWRDTYHAYALRVMLTELEEDGSLNPIRNGSLTITPASKTVTPNDSTTQTGNIVQVVYVEDTDQIIVVDQGAPGLPGSAAAETIIVAEHIADVEAVAAGIADVNLVGADLALGGASLIAQALPAATQTAADRVATAADRSAVNSDRNAADADVAATAADRVQTGADRAAASASATGAAASKDAADADALATAGDRVQTGLDRTATGADRTQTGLDVTAADLSAQQAQAAAAALAIGSKISTSGLTIPAGTMRVTTSEYATGSAIGGASYVRMDADDATIPGAAKFRTLDRYKSDGVTVDAANGGWWRLDKGDFNAESLGLAGDGTTNDTAATTALFALLNGRPQYKAIANGTYLTDGQHSVQSGTRLSGRGTFKKRSNSNAPVLSITGQTDVRISGITLDGNKSIQTSGGARQSRGAVLEINVVGGFTATKAILLDGVTIQNGYGNGLGGAGFSTVKITNCIVQACDGRGLLFGSYCADVLVQGCTITDCWQSGISHDGQGTMSSGVGTSSNIRLLGNHVENIHNDPTIADTGIGIEMIGSTNGVCVGNTVKNCDSMLISTGFADGIVVTSNKLSQTNYDPANTTHGQGWGIEATATSNSLYVGNHVDSVRRHIVVTSGSGNIVALNSFVDTARTSFPTDESYVCHIWLRAVSNSNSAMYGFGGPAQDHYFTGNTCTGGHIGVFLANPGTLYDQIARCTIKDNKFVQPYRAFQALGTAANYSDISFEDNEVRDAYDYVASMVSITRPRFSGVKVLGERHSPMNCVTFTSCVDPEFTRNILRGFTGAACNHSGNAGTLTLFGNAKDSGVGGYFIGVSGYSKYNVGDNPPTTHRSSVTVTAASYTLTADDDVILVNYAGAVTIYSSAVGRGPGRVIKIKDISGAAATNNITFNGNGVNVDGAATNVINANRAFREYLFDQTGGQWLVTG